MKAFSRGVHHLALCTDDMRQTVDFYVEVLGMPLVHAMKVPPGLGTGKANRKLDYIGPIPQLPGLEGIYFLDPNGIRLEFACQPADGGEPKVLASNTQSKEELRRELETLPGATSEWVERRLS